MAAGGLDSLVRSRYAQALRQGALLFTESSVSKHREHGAVFEVRFVPALAKKPASNPTERLERRDFVNPFLPYDERLHVRKLGTSHELLLNKYCVVPHHLLITTSEFRPQGEPLTEADFGAALESTSELLGPQIVFYNSGDESGASQPHKHMQVLPMPSYLDTPPTISLWLRSAPPVGRVFTSHTLPFAHYGIRLGTAPLVATELTKMYAEALAKQTAAYGPNVSYNVVLTREALLLVPRRQSSWNGISINSLGFAGLILCKTPGEQDDLDRVGILHVLTNVGYPRTAD